MTVTPKEWKEGIWQQITSFNSSPRDHEREFSMSRITDRSISEYRLSNLTLGEKHTIQEVSLFLLHRDRNVERIKYLEGELHV